MSYPKLGNYRKTVNAMKKKHKITGLDFDILLYASEQESVSQYHLSVNVSPSVSSIRVSVNYLVERGFLKQIRKRRTGVRGVSGLYVITGKARSMVTEFYMNMFPTHV